MQNTRLDSQCFPADTHRPGKHFPFTQHFPGLLLPPPLSCLHECLPELFFHVTVARFINSLPLPRCWWIISPKNTLQKLRGEDRARKSGPVVIYREISAPHLDISSAPVVTSSEAKLSLNFLGQMVAPVRDWKALDRFDGTSWLDYVQFAISFRLIFIFVPSSSKPFAVRQAASHADWRHRRCFRARRTKLNSRFDWIPSHSVGSTIISVTMKRKMLQTKVSTLISSSTSSSVLGLDLQPSNGSIQMYDWICKQVWALFG